MPGKKPIRSEQLGRCIKHARVARSLTLKKVAESLGISHTQISKIERGKFVFGRSGNVQKLCDFFKIDTEVGQRTNSNELAARISTVLKSPADYVALEAFLDALESAHIAGTEGSANC